MLVRDIPHRETVQRIFPVKFKGINLEFGWRNVRKKGEGNDLGETMEGGAYRNNDGGNNRKQLFFWY